ncbi:metal-dependent hydrolase [Alloalcanivorax marinus]|uniref:metal-dependent hydrolase n=1 Tax=Alloalcanivorax marinus TaxID=1177169 RepID=UPI0021D36EEF|nr:metal-dependent hydrolase [Alloalcanivorax marinus]MCU5786012.1 membrane-bound metal-dependent hydrolase [Alloalcanivorax marinus]
MDSLTQAALGGALGGAVLGRRWGRGAVLAGAALATLPDLDVLIDYGDAVANFSEHRGFSHSLLILTPLALLLAFLLSRWKTSVSFGRALAFTGLVLITHPLLDAFTTYGTQLWWPLGPPVALNSIFIIDPLYTLPLLVAVVIALIRPPATRALALGLVLSSGYLLWSLVAQQWMTQRVERVLAERGIEDAPVMVQPMPFSTFLWRATVMAPAARLEMVTGVFDGDGPLTVERFPRRPELERAAAALPDGQRLAWFTRGFLDYRRNGDRLVVTDVRLGVPGAHPFQFVIAERARDGWAPMVSTRLPRPMVNEEVWPLLWRRTFALAPVLCLHNLQLGESPAACGPP